MSLKSLIIAAIVGVLFCILLWNAIKLGVVCIIIATVGTLIYRHKQHKPVNNNN